jgi:hypothetical protein
MEFKHFIHTAVSFGKCVQAYPEVISRIVITIMAQVAVVWRERQVVTAGWDTIKLHAR